jgi:hypothetical protein
LWDRSGPPDPEVARLERLFGALGASGNGSRLAPFLVPRATPRRQTGLVVVLASLAAAIVALIGVSWRTSQAPPPAFEVTRLEGTPTIASRPVVGRSELRAGTWLETNDQARASIDITGVGRVDVEPGTRLGLLSTRPGAHRLQLTRGTMFALIWAPPGQFAVETPSSTAVDLGCAYTLTIDDDGVGFIRVTTGWVGYEWQGRESFIPAGAVCLTRPGLGPGTPHYDDTPASFKEALETLDLRLGTSATRAEALDHVLAEARAQDRVTLWHLLSRVDEAQRGRVFDRLAQFVPPPAGVTRAGVLAGQRQMLDDWWDVLGLGAANWWRVWKQQWRDPGG